MNVRWAAAVVLIVTVAQIALAQERKDGRVEIRGYAGGSYFPDVPWHSTIGASARFYLTERLGVEPQFLYARAPADDQDFLLIPNVTWDLRHRSNQVVPYVIGGAGLLVHKDRFGTSRWYTYGAGMGVKIRLTGRTYLSPEIRLGWEPFLQTGAGLGVSF